MTSHDADIMSFVMQSHKLKMLVQSKVTDYFESIYDNMLL